MPPLGEKLVTTPDRPLTEEELRVMDEVREGRKLAYQLMHQLLPYTKAGFLFFSKEVSTKRATYQAEDQPHHKRMQAWLARQSYDSEVSLYTQEQEDVGGTWQDVGEQRERVVAKDGNLRYPGMMTRGQKSFERFYTPEQQLGAVVGILDTLEQISLAEGLEPGIVTQVAMMAEPTDA